MELTYLARGADGKQYGPATLEQLEVWIREGRLRGEAELQRSDMTHWALAQDFLELQPVFNLPAAAEANGAPATVARQGQSGPADPSSIVRMKSGASWFYWVAGLSLINTIAMFSGGSWRFLLGLGVTQLLDGVAQGMGGGGKAVVLVLDLLAAGLFILFGVFAQKGHAWAFVTGMALFALDGLYFVLIQDWLGVAFHVFVLYCLFRGFNACRQLGAR